MCPLRTLDRFEERLIYKLWYGNMRHLSVALYAYHRGETLMCNAAASAYERECVEQAGQEALFAVMQEFGFTLEELVQGDGYAVNMDAYWEQMKKRKDRDSVARVAADPVRKLEKEERLIGPALACIRHGKLPYFIARSIALMYSFQNPEDAQAVELQRYVSEAWPGGRDGAVFRPLPAGAGRKAAQAACGRALSGIDGRGRQKRIGGHLRGKGDRNGKICKKSRAYWRGKYWKRLSGGSV